MSVPESRAVPSFGRYKDPVLLGSGGMGAVYRAVDPSLDRFVAIKVLTHREPRYVERFRREAQVLAKIMHPSIIQIYEIVGTDEDPFDPYIVMEYFAARPLDALLKDGPLSAPQVVSIMKQSAEGLKKAHANAVIHRDIKPANIMMAANGEVKLLDFGIAKALDAKKDLTGQTVLGTPYYMSPEQAMGQTIDARTDIYSLGITAFHLFTGRRPFEAKSKVDVMLAQVKTPLPKISEFVPGADPRFVELLERMCAKKKEERPQSCQELIDELDGLPRSLGGRGPDTDPTMAAVPVRAPAPAPRAAPTAGPLTPVNAQQRPSPSPQTPSPRPPRPAGLTPAPSAGKTPSAGRTPSSPGARPDVRRAPPPSVPRGSGRNLKGIIAGAVAALLILGGVLFFVKRSGGEKFTGRIAETGWIYPGPPASMLKKVYPQGGYGNCVFATRDLERGNEDAGSLRTSFAGGEAVFGRCYLAHQVGPSKAGEVWQELWIDGSKRAQIIYDPPLARDEDQVRLELGHQHGARLADLKPGRHVVDVWIFRQSDDAENPEPLAAGEFTLRK